jgi:hypothetical protein
MTEITIDIIDAWADSDGSWYDNAYQNVGTAECDDFSDRYQVIAAIHGIVDVQATDYFEWTGLNWITICNEEGMPVIRVTK